MKIRLILAMLTLAALLVACGESGTNELFAQASPETSMMTLYLCDGEKTTVYRLSNLDSKREILAELANRTATPTEATPKDVSFPTYSLEIGSKDGFGLAMTFSNGLLFNKDGSVYEFDFEWKKILTSYGFDADGSYDGRAVGLVERPMVLGADGWEPSLMRKAAEPEPQYQTDLHLEATLDGDRIDAVYRNIGSSDSTIGKSFSIHVELDGEWYVVPPLPDRPMLFESIAIEIQAGNEFEISYSLAPYGELPSGKYRLWANRLGCMFEIN